MKIYWFKAQAPLRVLALAKYLDVRAEWIEVDMKNRGLKTQEYAALNPNLKAPTLVDGDQVVWESAAIMAYLCIKKESNMWPIHNPMEQVEILRWLSWDNCHWSPAVAPFYFEHIVKSTFGMGSADREEIQSSIPDFLRFTKVLNDHLKNKDFIACERLTIADFHLASMARYWKESDMPMKEFPNIVRWLDKLQQIPAWSNPWPK